MAEDFVFFISQTCDSFGHLYASFTLLSISFSEAEPKQTVPSKVLL